MDTSGGLFEEIQIKDEVYEEDEDVVDKLAPSSYETDQLQIIHEDENIKCGEVLVGYHGNFTLMCALCTNIYKDLPSFGLHVHLLHMNVETNSDVPNPAHQEQRTVSYQSIEEGLTLSNNGEKPYIKVESDTEVNLSEEIYSVEELSHEKFDRDTDEAVMAVNRNVDEYCSDNDPELDDTSISHISKLTSQLFCPICCVFQPTNITFKWHMKIVHDVDVNTLEGLKSLSVSTRDSIVPKVQEKCKYCYHTFGDKAACHSHMESEHPDKLYTCPLCTKSFKRKDTRDYHIDSHEGQKIYKCPHCAKSYRTQKNLKEHINFHWNKWSQFACRLCVKKSAQKSNLNHDEVVSTEEQSFRCNDCSLNFDDERQLDLHMMQHTKIKYYKCSGCDEAFLCSKILKEHRLTHRNKRPLSSDTEKRTIKQEESLLENVHVDKLPSSKSELTNEADCKRVDAIAQLEVSTSIQDAHCKDNFQSESRSGTSKQSCETFCCYSCGTIFKKFESYRKHYRNVHTDMIENDCTPSSCEYPSFVPKVPKEMLCKFCLKTFNDPAAYQNHMENAHPDKRYSCPHCPQTFSQKVLQGRHIDIHEGNKRYKCLHCPKAFLLRADMKAHVVFIHMNRRSQFTCAFCDKKFLRNSCLKRHEQKHTIRRQIRCNECNLKFKDEKHLEIHMRKHIKMEN